MAFMLSPGVSRIVTIVLRVLTAIVLFVSLVMLVTNNQDYQDPNDNGNTKTARFYDQVGFQYMAATTVLGIGFSIYGTVIVALRIKRGNDEGNLLIDFYGQKVLSNLLVTGAVAGFLTVQAVDKALSDHFGTFAELATNGYYWGLYKTCSGLVLLGFFLSVALSILSSHTLARRNY
ncbi:CASP-like protein 4D1 [Rosa rugosa]|uniref:CASP-like protein 4D1 n=1 Tax=Rosa rugosa TaxID=74645 RepID=UPI002B406034|nr:CASP-like protein 4D1 [Rosa rugosa]